MTAAPAIRWASFAALAVFMACTSGVPAPEPTVPVTTVRRPARPAARPQAGGRTPATTEPSEPATQPSLAGVRDVGDTTIRVLLSSSKEFVKVASPDGLLFTAGDGHTIARSPGAGAWRVEHQGRSVRAIRSDGVPTEWTEQGLIAESLGDGLISVSGKPYRGTMAFYGDRAGVLSVNVLKIDDYLLGVVPLEIGTRAEADSAAVQAQAVTARSYAYVHLGARAGEPYDVTSGVEDQVYGGVAAETAVSSQAVESTRTLVIKYNGRIVNAPYHSTCGGSTAAASEVWRSDDEPYLQPVSDRIPGTDRYYCDEAPRFRWTRTIAGSQLNAALARYLASYTAVPGKKPGIARSVTVASRTPSGRVGTLIITTTRGNFVLRGNDTRYVLRQPGGEILNSTAFSVSETRTSDGSIGTLTIRGNGYGHGVGMCQAGAIGRARAGQDFRTILHTYYPGTTVAPPT
jgi:stage II sporulation protein D